MSGYGGGFTTLALAVGLTGIGFLVGYGYRSGTSGSDSPNAPAPAKLLPPVIKGLHSSPNGSMLAFTGVYSRSEKAGVFLYNTASGQWSEKESPSGWQDYVTQWAPGGASLLLEREKIPRPAVDAKGGLYLAPVAGDKVPQAGELQPLTRNLKLDGQKIITGFLEPDGTLVIKTRREPKTLYRVQGDELDPLDHATNTYGQNRAVRQPGGMVLYVVRDVPRAPGAVGLYRVSGGHATLLSPPWTNVSWSYVSDSGKSLIVARQAPNGTDWEWSLFEVKQSGVNLEKTATIAGDVITVYWSPDEKHVLGASGGALWRIDLPSLRAVRLGKRSDWNADDATWLGTENAVVVAAGGELWRVDAASGETRLLWHLPSPFWS